MTDWNTLVTWGFGDVPTEAQLDEQWRDNLSHLFEEIAQWFFPFANDPRFDRGVAPISNGATGVTAYCRASGGATIDAVRFRVGTSNGSVSVGCYRNNGSVGPTAQPGERIAASVGVACPSTGSADVALPSAVVFSPGDWLALSVLSGTATFQVGGAGAGSTFGIYYGAFYLEYDQHPVPDSPNEFLTGVTADQSPITLIGVPA